MVVRCLIVDDDRVFLRVARDLLEREGVHVVAVAVTGAEARRLSRDLQPDVVLVDIELGEESGFDLARQLNEQGRVADPRVILISSYPPDVLADLIADSPGLSFLPKPDLSGAAIRRIMAAAACGYRDSR